MARADLGYVNGKRQRKHLYAHNRAAAARLLAATLASKNRGENIPIGRNSLADFMSAWLADTVQPNKRPRTYQGYELLTRLHLLPTLGRLQLVKLDAETIQQLLGAKLREGLSPTTVRHIRTVLRRALNTAVKRKLISFNPATLVELPTADRPEIKPMSAEEARQFLDAARGHRFEALFVLALRLGLRRSELCGLQWKDVDFDARQLDIVRSIQRIPGQSLTPAPLKTRGSRRNIALPEEVVRALRAHHVRQLEARLAAGSWVDTDTVFANLTGKPTEPRLIDTIFKKLLKRAGLPSSFRFHDCRHTCCVLLLEAGAELYEVSKLLRHSSIGITADTYSHFSMGLRRNLVAKMDAVLA